jgi:hypothetical protein
LRRYGASTADRQLLGDAPRELLRIALAFDHRPEDCAACSTEYLREDRAHLDVRVLQHLVDACRVTRCFTHELRASPRQLSQLFDFAFGHEAALEQPVREQVCEPLRVVDVALAARQVLDLVCVGEANRRA